MQLGLGADIISKIVATKPGPGRTPAGLGEAKPYE
jgi:hypothetical protein